MRDWGPSDWVAFAIGTGVGVFWVCLGVAFVIAVALGQV